MKKMRDPIYGYISIENDIIRDIIDTPNFQRLRNVVQTSYSPLYASAVHNRFIHSLGVYYLGTLVSRSFEKSCKEITVLDTQKVSRYIKLFQYACLLHDVGHAPFSHTGEEFYLDANSSREQLHSAIVGLTEDKTLAREISNKNYSAAPHELMSAIVALRVFSHIFNSSAEKSFFARCICGYLYTETEMENSFLNCLISMLNSSFIDVDKLDYLIRDAYITGFDTVSIDYKRLLGSVKIVCFDTKCELVFYKSAISVIENVVLAHDAERKWIQNHPVVQYDSYLIKHAIEKINAEYDVFNYGSLTDQGTQLKNGLKVSFLSDGDILFLMKNMMSDSLIHEYFSRKDRRHPLWKSESEYKAFFNPVFGNNTYSIIESEFEELVKYLNYTNKSSEINAQSLRFLEDDIKENEKLLQNSSNKTNIEKQLKTKRKHLKIIKIFEDFAKSQGIEFDFVILKANQFSSGFSKIGFEDIKIMFDGLGKVVSFKDITNTLLAKKSEREKFYYLFYRRTNETQSVNIMDLLVALGKEIVTYAYE